MENDALKRSFEAAYVEWADGIFRFLFFKLGDRERAKELTQEAFMKAWTYAASGNAIGRMRPFLYTVANNLFRNELRSKRDISSLDTMMDRSHFEPRAAEISAEEAAEGRRVLEAVWQLAPAYREVLVMRYVDGLSIKEISRAVGESAVTISVRLHRGLRKLRKAYEGNHE